MLHSKGNQIFTECFQKLLKGKTILLITHQLKYLSESDNVIVMSNGRIESHGAFKNSKTNFAKILPSTDEENDLETPEENSSEKEDPKATIAQRSLIENFKDYLDATGSRKFVAFVFLLTISTQAASTGINKFLVLWTDWEQSLSGNEDFDVTSTRNQYLLVYSALIAILIVFSYNSYVLMFTSLIKLVKFKLNHFFKKNNFFTGRRKSFTIEC